MSNQIIATLLTTLVTLVGGALAIVGSLIANHYNFKKTLLFERRKEVLERRKKIQEILEITYESALKIENSHIEIVRLKAGKKDGRDLMMQNKSEIDKIQMLIHLHVPDLIDQTRDFVDKVGWSSQIIDYSLDKLSFEEYTEKMYDNVYMASTVYRTVIRDYIQNLDATIFAES